MKQARSIFLGSELIDIHKASHSDYFNKGLICPFCLEKVFFAKEFERVVEGKIVKVSASFKHHKGDPLSCELRSQSSEGKEILKAISSESQEQRKALWEKYLWAMFKTGVYKNLDISKFGLSNIGRQILETPITKPINLKLRVDASTPKHKYITVDELGFVFVHCFQWLPFNYDYYQELAKQNDDTAKISIDILHRKLEELYKASNQIKDGINGEEFYAKTHVKTNRSLHHSICMEVFKALTNPDLSQIYGRLLSFIFLDLNEFVPAPEEVFFAIFQLAHDLKKVKWEPDGEQIKATHSMQISLLNFIYPVYIQYIILIDWYELSKQPWQNLVKKSDILKRIPSSSGKGFGQIKHKK